MIKNIVELFNDIKDEGQHKLIWSTLTMLTCDCYVWEGTIWHFSMHRCHFTKN